MDLVATMDIAKKYGKVPRLFRGRTCPYDTLTDVEFRKDYRFTRPVFYKICGMLAEDLERCHGRGVDMTIADQVALSIHLLGRNVMQSDAARIAGCHQATVSRVLSLFLKGIVKRAGEYIKWPTSEECTEIRRAFLKRYRIPGIVGIIDGTHCRIQRPTDHEEDFVCRKGYHSINAGVVVDFEGKARWISATWPGSAHDSRVFKTSQLYAQLKAKEVEGAIVGDSAYGSEEFLLKPLNIVRNSQEMRYNNAICSARSRIEQCFGVLKRQFHILHGECRYDPEKAAEIIVCCCVLRNISIENKEPPNYDEYQGADRQDGEVPSEPLDDTMNPPNMRAREFVNNIITRFF